jgi:cysteine desulfurase/selenocysteine lyase
MSPKMTNFLDFKIGDLASQYRSDFPIYDQCINGKPIIYLDHAATSQKPQIVIDALANYYSQDNANVHRAAHSLSARATDAFEAARLRTAMFLNSSDSGEIVFTRNATEAINLVANTWACAQLQPGDEILTTVMEHHSNLVPWQLVAERKGAVLRHVCLTDNGELDMDDFRAQLNSRTKIVSIVHLSNSLGCLNPIAEIVELSHRFDAKVLVDACQSLAHIPVDVKSLDCDWLVGSSHKLCGPTGMGFLWGRRSLLEQAPPFLGGGEMIDQVYLDHSTWAELPHKFEAGTPAIGEAIGMGVALDFLSNIGLERIHCWEQQLICILWDKLSDIEGIKLLGPSPAQQPNRAALASFVIDGTHPHDLCALLDASGICIRSGHHCTQPLHRLLGINASARASLAFTTSKSEVGDFVEELASCVSFLRQNS